MQKKGTAQSVEKSCNQLSFDRRMIRVDTLKGTVDCTEASMEINIAEFGSNILQHLVALMPREIPISFILRESKGPSQGDFHQVSER